MLDRESGFADEKVIGLLRRSFVPVALDVWYEERRQDAAGELFRKVVYQREGMEPGRTTQGLYVCAPDGTLLAGWNNRDAARLRDRLGAALDGWRPRPAGAPPETRGLEGKRGAGQEERDAAADPRFARAPPDGGLVVAVHSRIVKADWPDTRDAWERIHQRASGFDHLWITRDEVEALARGDFPRSLAVRIARFHCIDNTRGEPPMWEKGEVRALAIGFADGGGSGARTGAAAGARPARAAGARSAGAAGGGPIDGEIALLTDAGDRGFTARAFGVVERSGDRITRFDLVIRGEFFGEGTYTKGAPPGKFTLAIAFTLAGDGADGAVPPQGARWLDDYYGRV